ncbi:MAG: hypothetical protein VSS75_031765 [Candidatus Parabeggiatoa sp.]|nr:hypothetical protein [Candidatus Parabeggiatoa sp.]
MGAVNFSIDLELVKTLKTELLLEVFVETGTFEGASIKKVQNLFKEIYTVELSQQYFEQVKNLCQDLQHVYVYHGDSPSFLTDLSPKLADKSTLYWLDAHWCVADYTSGETSQCPLLDELIAIHQLNKNSVILIDDARLFLCPPPYPHEISQWPDFNEVMRALKSLSDWHDIMVLNDIIIFYPMSIKKSLTDYAYKHAIDWLSVMDKANDYNKLHEVLQSQEQQMQEQEKQMREKDELVAKHHHFAQTLLAELRKRGISINTQWS